MAAPTNHWKLGLFVVSGVVMLLTAVAALGARSLHTEVARYKTYFDESVQGLEVGSPIKFRGVMIGTVGKIDIAPDHRMVEVESDLVVKELHRLGLEAEADPVTHLPRKRLAMQEDLRAQLASSGLTGVKYLLLDFFPVADNPAPTLTFPIPENYIPATPSTLKSIEDSVVRAVHRLPEVLDQMSGVVARVDAILGDVQGQKLPEAVASTLGGVNRIVLEAQRKIEAVDTRGLSKEAQRTLTGLTTVVGQMNAILGRVDGEKGLLASVARASDALGDTVRGADNMGGQLEEALQSVQEAARSIRKLADVLEKDPDMLLKGRARAPEKNR